MKHWIAMTTGIILALGGWGCKLEKSTGAESLPRLRLQRAGVATDQGPATPSGAQTAPEETAAEAGAEPAPGREPTAPEEAGATTAPSSGEEKPKTEAESTTEETAGAPSASEPAAPSAEEEATESAETEASENETTEKAEAETAPEKPARVEPPESSGKEEQQPAAPPAAPARAETEPTPGVKRLAVDENARLLEAHLVRAEEALQATKFASAKQALASALRALSYLDAQRPTAVAAQALDQVALRLDEKDLVAARVALQRAEDWIEGTPLDKALAESLLELDDHLKAKKLSSAADTVEAIRNKLAERGERENRILAALRTALVQAQLALERHTPGVALAEVQEARTQVKKLAAPATE